MLSDIILGGGIFILLKYSCSDLKCVCAASWRLKVTLLWFMALYNSWYLSLVWPCPNRFNYAAAGLSGWICSLWAVKFSVTFLALSPTRSGSGWTGSVGSGFCRTGRAGQRASPLLTNHRLVGRYRCHTGYLSDWFCWDTHGEFFERNTPKKSIPPIGTAAKPQLCLSFNEFSTPLLLLWSILISLCHPVLSLNTLNHHRTERGFCH